jgi:tetratricopeptide (TPR) repeat protein
VKLQYYPLPVIAISKISIQQKSIIMKFFLATLTLLSIAAIPTLVAVGQRTDDDAIKKAIQAVWAASVSKNPDGVKANWKQDPRVVNTYVSRNNYFSVDSWDSLSASIERTYKANPKPNRTSFTIRNHTILANGSMAFAAYDAIVTPVDADPNTFPYQPDSIYFRTYQVLEKEGSLWKTLAMINTNPKSYDFASDHAIESDINEIGYRFLLAKRYNEAIEVFQLNVKLYPNLWNTYDSLGEAYAAAGNNKLAIKNYEKSIKLNPKSESGKTALAKLKQL